MTGAAAGTGGRRRVAPGSARSLLLAVLGEFVWPEGGVVWSSALLRLLIGAGVEKNTARQALTRAKRHGWLASTRVGRETRWSLTPLGRGVMERGLARVRSLTVEQRPWDGRWLLVSVSIPRERAATRNRLTRRLEWAGFGSPAPGLWISPHTERESEVADLLAALDLQDQAICLVGPLAAAGLRAEEAVRRAWNPDALVPRYAALVARYAAYRPGAGDDLLVAHLGLVDEWQHLPYLDPQLPEELLPQPWPGLTAARRIEELRDEWNGRALDEWRRVVAETAP